MHCGDVAFDSKLAHIYMLHCKIASAAKWEIASVKPLIGIYVLAYVCEYVCAHTQPLIVCLCSFHGVSSHILHISSIAYRQFSKLFRVLSSPILSLSPVILNAMWINIIRHTPILWSNFSLYVHGFLLFIFHFSLIDQRI